MQQPPQPSTRPALKAFAEGGAKAAANARQQRKAAMWKGLAAPAIADSDTECDVDQKRFLVHLVVVCFIYQLLSLMLWSGAVPSAAFAVSTLFMLGGAMSWLFVNKDHAALRWALIASGYIYTLLYFVSESCLPLKSTGGKVFTVVFPTVFFHVPCGGKAFEFSIALCAYVAVYIVLVVIETNINAPCFAPLNQEATHQPHAAIFLMGVIPWATTIVGAVLLFLSKERRDAERKDQDLFSLGVLSRLDAGNLPDATKQTDAFVADTKFIPRPMELALCHATFQAQMYKNTIVTISPSANYAPRSPNDMHLSTTLTIDPSRSASRTASQNAMRRGSEDPKAASKSDESPQQQAVTLITNHEDDGEVPRPGLTRRASGRRGSLRGLPTMLRKRRFVAMLCMPSLHDYLQDRSSEVAVGKMLFTQYRDSVRRAVSSFNGTTLNICFDEIFVEFDHCADAVATCAYLTDLVETAAQQHRDARVISTKAYEVLCVVMNGDVVLGEVEDHCVMGWAAVEPVFQVLKTFAKTLNTTHGVLVAESLTSLVEEDFKFADTVECGCRRIESVVEKDSRGHPVISRSQAKEAMAETDDAHFDMPTFAEVVQQFANSVSASQSWGEASTSFPQEASIVIEPPPSGGSSAGSQDGSKRATTAAQGSRRRRMNPEALALWKQFDTDGNGTLSIDEIREVLDTLGIMMTESELRDFYAEADRDGSGTISQEEFTKAFFNPNLGGATAITYVRRAAAKMQQTTGVDNLPIVVAAWRKYDTDGSGSLDAEELGKVLNDLGIATSQEEVEWMVKKLDANGNGNVDFEEFASLFSEDVSDIKLNITKQRIQTVARVMQNKQTEQVFSTEIQKQRDALIARSFVIDSFTMPLLGAYILYNFGQQLYRVSLQNDMIASRDEVIGDMIIDLVYIVWVVLKLTVMPRESSGHTMVLRKDVLLDYVKSLDFVVDFLVLLPLDFVYIGYDFDPYVTGTYGFYRLNKIFSLYYLEDCLTVAFRMLSPGTYRILDAMVWFFCAAHIAACGIILTARSVGEGLMFDMLGTNVLISQTSTRYLFAIMWAMQQLAGNIRGACLQDTEEQQVLELITVLGSLVVFPILLAIVGDVVTGVSAEGAYLDRVDDLRSYFEYARRRMNEEDAAVLEAECIGYYLHLFETTGSLDISNNPLTDVPVELMIQMTVETGTEMLRKVPIFKEACENVEFVHELTVKLVPRVIEPETCVMRKGERGSNMYFITCGEFNIVVDGVGVVFTLKKGNFFGEIALLHNVKRTATIVCGKRYANVQTLDKRDFDEVLQTFPQCLSAISKAAEDRLNQILAAEVEEQRKIKEQRQAEQAAKALAAAAAAAHAEQRNLSSPSHNRSPADGTPSITPLPMTPSNRANTKAA